MTTLRISQPSIEGPFQASKWLQNQVLIDVNEMEALLNELGDFFIYSISGVAKNNEGEISKETFLERYREYVGALKKGVFPEESRYRPYFSTVFTVSPDMLYAFPIGEEQHLIKIAKPVIQLQVHRMDYSKEDGKFRSMVFGDSVLWGIQFSYPQLFQDNKTREILPVQENPLFPNTPLFRKLQRWLRQHTVATPFLVQGKKVNVPIRLGKQCFSWINNHPQLIQRGLNVQT